MPVAFVTSAASNGNAAGGTSITSSYTVAAGSDRLLLVQTAEVASASAVTYAGASLTAVGSLTGTVRTWRRVAPATGANNIVFTVSSYSLLMWNVANFTGVDQTTPLGSQVATSGAGSAPTTGSITVPTDGMAWGGMLTGYTTTTTPTITAGTMASWIKASGGIKAGGYRSTTGSLSWSLTSAPNWWAQGFPINPSVSFTAKLPKVYSQAIQGSVI